jgi:hypothetical protein
MAAAEVRQRIAVHDRPGRGAEAALQDVAGIGARDGVHRIEAHAEAARPQQVADAVEVEQLFHQRGIVGDRVDDLDRHVAHLRGALAGEVDWPLAEDAEAIDLAGPGVDRVGQRFRRRAAVGDVVLDAEIALRPARIVAGRQDDAAQRPPGADEI